MEGIIEHCEKLLELIDIEYPNQKNYSGIIQKLFIVIEDLMTKIKMNEDTEVNIEFSSLTRQFVDETTNYASPILTELEIIENYLKKNLSSR